ncbi:MAG TPA: DEAD/DEAH box helicase, partial [Candidatus Wallbacteria bacterium]|nr:DEAD/DEAH box helicase [Candidatus Wallbacteria bacterium]
MSLNPVKFGKDVIEQFGRYLRNSYPIADGAIAAQFNEKMGYTTDSLIAKGPYIYLNKPFIEGAKLETLIAELGLHRTLTAIFKFPIMYSHQEKTVRAVLDNKNIIVSTGTGSGKTESFLLPIIDYCLKSVEEHARDNKSSEGLAAILIYPMNALVNDQLERLRPMLAGTGITFGRYTGETPQNSNYGLKKLTEKRAYTAAELEAFYDNKADLPLPYEECYSRDEIVEKKPKILLTNYSQLEYLLLRDKDLELFKTPALKFLVLDEVHTYTGELGSEMSCLIRRIKALMHDKITCIGTSATVANSDSAEVIRNFAANLFGETKESFAIIEEEYKQTETDEKLSYCPDMAKDIEGILSDILDEVRKYQLSNEVSEIGPELLKLAEKLTGQKAGTNYSKNIDRLGELLIRNKYLGQIENIFSKPALSREAFLELKKIGNRAGAKDSDLEAELLAYLTIGAIAKYDNEPVLRPKLHYFLKGMSGVTCTIERDDKVQLYFDDSFDKELYLFNFKICRNCGQHFFNVASELNSVSENGVGVYNVLRNLRNDEALAKNERGWLITDNLNELDEDSKHGEPIYLCKFCGSIHS